MKVIKPQFEFLRPADNEEARRDALRAIELAGRTCYKSENKITDESAPNFVKMLITRGHEAMLEHASMSVKLICERGITHEIVRHRVASYAQESTRYVNYSKNRFGKEITSIDISGGLEYDPVTSKLDADQKAAIIEEWLAACEDSERHYMKMLELGATPQIARSVLNNSVKTEIVVTANMREWRHIFSLRADTPAHPQMRELMLMLLEESAKRFPELFGDIAERLLPKAEENNEEA